MNPGGLRSQVRRGVALGLVVALYLLARLPEVSGSERARLAARFSFEVLELPGRGSNRKLRRVHPSYEHIAAWISAVGAAAGLADLDRDGLANDVVWVDPRVDEVFVAAVSGTGFGARYETFCLGVGIFGETVAPTGCLPRDMNEDGLVDLLVTFWGRPPVAYLRRGVDDRSRPDRLTRDHFVLCEIADAEERWFTNASVFSDLDGDGHLDLVVGNYYPDGARVLDDAAETQQSMQLSMSRARNGGRNHFLLWESATEATAGEEPTVVYREVETPHDGTFWTLALGAADLDGDLLPEIYIGNDFGPDQLLHNRSRPGELLFEAVRGSGDWLTPPSKVLGRDSYKGMGVDFSDLNGDGLLDIYVSNITTEFGLQESQFLFLSTGELEAFRRGVAPYVDGAEGLGLSRSSWAWDARLADFDNDGTPEALQAVGFLKGDTGRWPELHEVAMGNDQLLASTLFWHHMLPGDDLSGDARNPFFVRASDGRYYDLAPDLGLDLSLNTRAIATADVDGDGDLDFVLGNQWETSVFVRNDAPAPGRFLGLHLMLPLETRPFEVLAGAPPGDMRLLRAVGAAVRVVLPDGRVQVAQVDGGDGHSGACSPELHFGLGALEPDALLEVEIRWRDRAGNRQLRTLELTPGWYTVILSSREPLR